MFDPFITVGIKTAEELEPVPSASLRTVTAKAVPESLAAGRCDGIKRTGDEPEELHPLMTAAASAAADARNISVFLGGIVRSPMRSYVYTIPAWSLLYAQKAIDTVPNRCATT
jgi:hypothetical protein